MSLAGTWRATLTSGALASSPKPLRLELDATGNGTLLVGDAALPPPTDPSIGFPPEAELDAAEAAAEQVGRRRGRRVGGGVRVGHGVLVRQAIVDAGGSVAISTG